MFTHIDEQTQHQRFFISWFALFCLLLVGCAPGTLAPDIPGGASHAFIGKLSLLQVPMPYGTRGQIVLGTDGNLWFPAGAACAQPNQPCGAIERLTPAGKFKQFPLTTPYSYPTQIALGPHEIWFSAFHGNGQLTPIGDTEPQYTGGDSELGRMSMDGQFHLFGLPVPGALIDAIAVGPDNNLWFAETINASGANANLLHKLGRVTPDGAFQEFPLTLRQPTDLIQQLIAGPDGNLWFSIESTLANYSAIGEMGRMTPQGAVTIFDLGKFVIPHDMTIGPDHNLWFSDGHDIGRITMNGQVKIFQINTNRANYDLQTDGITVNGDGALWFATRNASVGRITTDGAITFYPFPPNAYFDNGSSSLDMGHLRGIVSGADGTLWLTDNDQIGHFV